MLHQLTEDLGTGGHVGKPHNGVVTGYIFRQFHGPHNVIGENGYLDHRKVQPFPQLGGRTAPGNNNIIIVVKILAGQFHTLLQVSYKYCKFNVRVLFGLFLHEKLHILIGGNAQKSDF